MKYERQYFPELKWEGGNKTFSCQEDKRGQLALDEVPLVQFYEEVKGKGRYLLLGEAGGCSKTAQLELLRMYLQTKSCYAPFYYSNKQEEGNVYYYYYDLKKQNDSRARDDRDKVRENIQGLLSLKEKNANVKVCVIFDSFDEVRKPDDRDKVELLLQGKDDYSTYCFDVNQIDFYIIGSRTIPEYCKKEGDGSARAEEKNGKAGNFQVLRTLPYAEEKVKSILASFGVQVKKEELLKLLTTPFFMLCYRDVVTSTAEDNTNIHETITNETSLITRYLETVCEEKAKEDSNFESEETPGLCKDYAFDVGEAVYKEECGNKDCSVKKQRFRLAEKVFNSILVIEEEKKIRPSFAHVKFRNYCLAVYLKDKIFDDDTVFDVYISEEACYYIGQILRNEAGEDYDSKLERICGACKEIVDKKEGTILFDSFFTILLGYTDGVFDEKIKHAKEIYKHAIAEKLFKWNKRLISITIPDRVTSIRDGAFYGCIRLTSIAIPNSVTSIGEEAFYNCSRLTSITIGNRVTSIGKAAFYNCSRLTSITIGNRVTSIGKAAFCDCDSLTKVNYTGTVDKWAMIGFDKYDSNPLFYAEHLYINDVEVTEVNLTTATYISDYAFYYCSRLTSIAIPNSVTSIGEEAFYSCDRLTSITIPDSVTSIGEEAFYDCDKLIEVYNLSTLSISKGSTSNGYVGYYAKNVYSPNSGNSKLHTVDNYIFYEDGDTVYLMGYEGKDTVLTLPDTYNGKKYEIYERAFYYCDSLTSITIPNSVTSIGLCAFCNCDSLTSITIPNSVTSIGRGAFGGCSSLTKVNCTGTVDKWAMISFSDGGSNPLYYAKHLYINDVEVTGVNLTTATKISDYAFYGCSSLTSITIPDRVTSLGEDAFYGCSSLKSITISNSLMNIGGEGVLDNAFRNCNNIDSITLSDSVTRIGKDAFSWCENLTSIAVMQGNSKYHSEENCLIETASKTLVLGIATSIIPADGSVTSIGESAFEGCSSLTSITIPDKVTSIGNYAFFYCRNLTSIALSDNVVIIGREAFSGCNKIIQKENGVSYIDKRVINCDSLVTQVFLRSNTKGIEDYAFAESDLTSIIIPISVMHIGSGAFSYCNRLTKITILGKNIKIDDEAFDVDTLKLIIAPKNSTAEEYAIRHGIAFRELEEE